MIADKDLPPLPEPALHAALDRDGFTAEQMHAYARQAVEGAMARAYVRAGFVPVAVVDGSRMACMWHAHNQRSGVVDSVLRVAYRENWAGGTFDDRMRHLGWTLEPLYLAATHQDTTKEGGHG